MELRRAAIVGVVAACGAPHAVEDAHRVVPPPVIAAADAGGVDAPVDAPVGTTGDAAIHVVWRNVPVADRASPGRTPCNTPRAAAVAPTTTWGVPDAFVLIDRGSAGGSAAAAEAQLVLADCALAPRALVGASLVIASRADRPVQLSLRERGIPAALVDGTAVPIQLPIAGHSVRVPLVAGRVYELAAGDETAWIVAGHALATDPSGTATWRDLAVGVHEVTAWLPPRAGHPAKLAHGEVTVTAGGLAEATLDLTPAGVP